MTQHLHSRESATSPSAEPLDIIKLKIKWTIRRKLKQVKIQ